MGKEMFLHVCICPRVGGTPWSLVPGPFQGSILLSCHWSCPMSCSGRYPLATGPMSFPRGGRAGPVRTGATSTRTGGTHQPGGDTPKARTGGTFLTVHTVGGMPLAVMQEDHLVFVLQSQKSSCFFYLVPCAPFCIFYSYCIV